MKLSIGRLVGTGLIVVNEYAYDYRRDERQDCYKD